MSESRQFIARAAVKARDDQHFYQLSKAIASYDGMVGQTKSRQFQNWTQARALAATIKDHVLARLPELLEQFEQNLLAAGGKVFWAETAEDARSYVLALAQKHQAKRVVKSKSMVTEEIGLNEHLEKHGVEVWESDLGELIVQLNQEKPYHIVTPAMHKSKAEISRLFQEKLQAPPTDSAEELTMVARRHLRDVYLSSTIGVTGANFLVADLGAVVVTENEGNARLTMACPPVHVVIAGLEKMLPRLSDLSLFLPLLATSGTGQEMTSYNSIILGPRHAHESDGPAEMHVILLDNGRSALYQQAEFRAILRCIRCGACLNACPVYRVIGGHAYNTTYQGPIGAVITPHYSGFGKYHHLAYASSLCGACSEVCPVQIDIHHLLLKNRRAAVRRREQPWFWRTALRVYAWVMTDAARLQRARRWLLRLWPWQRLWRRPNEQLPPLSPKSFRELWITHENQP